MAKILYGVGGEGMGHAIRSKVILEHLSKKHDVTIVSSNRAYKFLSEHFNDVNEVYGFTIAFNNNKVREFKTLINNVKCFKKSALKQAKEAYQLIKENKPDLIISDFEPFTNAISTFLKIPLISVDNIHSITNLKINAPKKYLKDYLVAKLVIRSFITKPAYCVITTFFPTKIKNRKTYVVKPILREGILKAKTVKGEKILVYQICKHQKDLIDNLRRINETFVVYGTNKNRKIGNCVFRKFSEKEIIDDLASCKAVITNGGFTLISEAIHLGKPVFSIPVGGHFEQIINGMHLKKLGYGEFCENISAGAINRFISNLGDYEKKLKMYKGADNSRALAIIDSIIDKYSKPSG